MKKILFILIIPAIAFASGWDNPNGTSTNPITAAYITTLTATTGNITTLSTTTGAITSLTSNSVLPITANTGVVGSETNAYNSIYGDSIYTSPNIGGVNSWVGMRAGTTAGNGVFVSSDSAAGSSRVTATFGYNRNLSAWYFTNLVNPTSFKVGTSTSLTGIYAGNATGWTLENTVDTNVVSGATAASRISLTLRSATATLTAPLTGVTVVDTLFVACAAADTAAVRAASVDYLIFK